MLGILKLVDSTNYTLRIKKPIQGSDDLSTGGLCEPEFMIQGCTNISLGLFMFPGFSD